MNESKPDEFPTQMLRSLQIVIGALAAGVFAFAVVATVARSNGKGRVPDSPMMSYLAIGAAALALVMRVVVPRVMTKAGRKRLANERPVLSVRLMQLHMNRTIAGAAMFEGAAFFLLTAYLAEGEPWALAGGLAVGGLMAVLQFPTLPRVEAALAADRQAIEDERAVL
jgi:hypothetical protein